MLVAVVDSEEHLAADAYFDAVAVRYHADRGLHYPEARVEPRSEPLDSALQRSLP